jgi:SAM-dependent methyltransferase
MAPDASRAIHVAQWECPACRVLCAYPAATPDRIRQYYGNDYYGRVWTDPEAVWTRNVVAYRTELGLIDAMIPASAARGAALDVGCGYGVLLHLLGKRGYDAVGCEIGTAGIAYCRQRGLRVVRATAPELPFPDGAFHLVVTFHVIEHVLDPPAFVRSLSRVLAPGGAAVIVTDHRWTTELAYKRTLARLRGRVPPFFTSTDHTFVFAPEHVANLLRQAGCEHIRTAAFTHVPPGESLHWRAYKGVFRTLDRWRGWGDYMMIVGCKPSPPASAARAA